MKAAQLDRWHMRFRWTTYLLTNVDNRVVPATADEGAVRFDDDAMLVAVLHDVLLLAEGVQLRLDIQLCVVATHEAARRTSIWFTAGVSRPASLISSRCFTPLCMYAMS